MLLFTLPALNSKAYDEKFTIPKTTRYEKSNPT